MSTISSTSKNEPAWCIDGHTRWVGVIADPVVHLRTPQFINEAARHGRHKLVCLGLHVPSTALSDLLHGLRGVRNLAGMVVTMPHKRAVGVHCGELSSAATLAGSVNVLRWDPQACHWCGANFDGLGFVAGLMAQGHCVRDRRVLLLGAGGVGRAISMALAGHQPAHLTLHNRSAEAAQKLLQDLRVAFPDQAASYQFGPADATGHDIVINATSLGMQDDDALPVAISTLAEHSLVAEVVMRDGDTPLLAHARQRGCVLHHGQHMLRAQLLEISHFLALGLRDEDIAMFHPPVGRAAKLLQH